MKFLTNEHNKSIVTSGIVLTRDETDYIAHVMNMPAWSVREVAQVMYGMDATTMPVDVHRTILSRSSIGSPVHKMPRIMVICIFLRILSIYIQGRTKYYV
jgi:hypothetical protein